MGRHQKLPPMSGGVGRMARSQSNDLGGSRNSIASYEEHQSATPNMRKSKMNVGGDPGAGEDEEEEEAKRKKNEGITNEE